jgi:prephenate dehydrogenase
MFKRIAVFGLGLLGGSICRALKTIEPSVEIVAFGRDLEKLEKARIDGSVDEIQSINNVMPEGIELVIVSTPVIVSIDIIKRVLSGIGVSGDTIVIDVGSVKGPVIHEVEKSERADRFIGCHPMAGSENMGYEYSSADLFVNASVIVTPNRFNREEDIYAVCDFWRVMKARTIIVPAEFHDRVVSFTSHLPHMLSGAFINALSDYMNSESNGFQASPSEKDGVVSPERGDIKIEYFMGKGFRDFTRLSSGSPDIWTDIFLLNRENICNSLHKVIEGLQSIERLVCENENLEQGMRLFLEKAKEFRGRLSL